MLNLESKVLSWCRGSSEDAVKLIELMCSDSSKDIRRSHVLKLFLAEERGNYLILRSWEYGDDLPYHIFIRDLLDIESFDLLYKHIQARVHVINSFIAIHDKIIELLNQAIIVIIANTFRAFMNQFKSSPNIMGGCT